jgi:hypothetical protein
VRAAHAARTRVFGRRAHYFAHFAHATCGASDASDANGAQQARPAERRDVMDVTDVRGRHAMGPDEQRNDQQTAPTVPTAPTTPGSAARQPAASQTVGGGPRLRIQVAPDWQQRPHATCADAPPARLLRGIEQFNQGEYFECHETLEALWNDEPGPVRTLYKGILQVGVGCYHLLRGNYRGALIKLESGAAYLDAFAPRCSGVEVEALIAAARRLRAELVALGPERFAAVDRALLPRVEVAESA